METAGGNHGDNLRAIDRADRGGRRRPQRDTAQPAGATCATPADGWESALAITERERVADRVVYKERPSQSGVAVSE
jgi:hypothetical protein